MRRVVVEVTRSSLRLLGVEGSVTEPRVTAFAVEPLPDDLRDEPLQRALAGIRRRGATILHVIPREQLITRRFTFPSTDPGELARMVALSGTAQLPLPAAQAVADFHVVAQQDGESQVELVAGQRDLIERRAALLRGAGVEPRLIVPSAWGLLAWYLRFGRSAATPEPALVVNADADHTDVIVVQGERLLFSRSLSHGAADGPAALLLQELDRSLSSLRQELSGVEIAGVVCTGLGALGAWGTALEQHLRKPVVVKPVHERLPLRADEVSAAVGLGVACAERRWLLNLLPRELADAQAHRQRLRALTVTSGVLLAALLAGAGGLSAVMHRRERSTAQAVERLRQLESATHATEAQLRTVEAIEQVLASRRQTVERLAEVFRLTPPEITFETITYARARRELLLRGSAFTTRQVLDYIRALDSSRQWQQAELRYSARRTTPAGSRTEFEILLHHEAAS